MHPVYGNQRYYALHNYYKKIFGERVLKAVIDCGFSCPNKDGTLSTRGCLFCSEGSGYFTGKGSVTEQLAAEKMRICLKHPHSRIIAYFQTNTNTYAPVDKLRKIYEEALAYPDVAGISIATRADCISDDILLYLKELSEKTHLTVELGLQTIHEDTARKMNLCCERRLLRECTARLKKHGIRVCLHIINGLPGETKEQMLETAGTIGKWKPDGIKIQLLHIIRGTPLADIYEKEHFHMLTEDEYVDIVSEQLRYLPPETVCERLTGDGDAEKLIAPMWSKNKRHVLNSIAHSLKEKDVWQGDLFTK